jgi:ApaG protein
MGFPTTFPWWPAVAWPAATRSPLGNLPLGRTILEGHAAGARRTPHKDPPHEGHGCAKNLLMPANETSTAVTEGIRITVRSAHVAEQSLPLARRYVFSYTVRITNEGSEPVQLRSRHWIITDSMGKVEEVRGPGVVGHQPHLRPGEHFEYTSGCVLQTPRGEMRGTYQMQRPDNRLFDAVIAPFLLAMPHSMN